MLLANRSPLGSYQNIEKAARSNSASPQRISPREYFKSCDSSPGRTWRTVVAAEAGPTVSAEAEANPSQPAVLESAKRLLLHLGAANLPHPEKQDYGGEDSYFTSPVGGGAFGVADGVGGWQDSGINPAEYSRTFMRLACGYLEGKKVRPVSAAELAVASGGSSRGLAVTPADASLRDTPPAEEAEQEESVQSLTPKGALAAAHSGTRLPGSTTACILRLDRSARKILAANLGDSGFLLIRHGTEVFRSPALQHFFDCPLQFAAYPDYTSATDTSEDAGVYELPVQPGDVVIAGTDGLWDNVPTEEIIQLLPRNATNMSQLAEDLVQLASKHAHDKKYPSPYSQEAIKQGIDIPWILRLATASFADGKIRLGHLKGGKVDDITVVVAYVSEESYTPPPPVNEPAE